MAIALSKLDFGLVRVKGLRYDVTPSLCQSKRFVYFSRICVFMRGLILAHMLFLTPIVVSLSWEGVGYWSNAGLRLLLPQNLKGLYSDVIGLSRALYKAVFRVCVLSCFL